MKLDDTWKPQRYPNGVHFSRRDALPLFTVFLLCLLAYLAHDVLQAVPLPSEETMTFVGVVCGLYLGRRLQP